MKLRNMKKNKIILAGSGYLANSLIKLLTEIDDYENIIELSRTVKKRKSNIISLSRDFDELDIDLDCVDKAEIVYMAPPNAIGLTDSRLSNFIKNIKTYEIKKILYISTSGVYGDCNGMIVDEKNKTNPLTDRAKRRVDAETQLTNYCSTHQVNLIILRTPGIYGKDRLPIAKIRDGEPLIKKEESRITNLIHVEDLARIVVCAMKKKKLKKIEVFNVSDGCPITSTEYYEIICNILGVKIEKYISYEEAANIFTEKRLSFLKESRQLNVKKMQKLLPGCIKYTDLEKGVIASLES